MTTECSQRRCFTPEQKVAILRQHLIEKVPVSALCDQHGLRPNQFYDWQKQLFENATAAFERRPDGHHKRLEEQNAALRAKLQQKDEVIAEIMASHVELKKSLGEA
ncbi:MAG: transposase [Planctomycetes bacterium]|nr:transposase [Planctomycetota bacterium]